MAQIERNKKTEHQFNVSIDSYLDFPSYLGSYKRSFDILVKSVVKSNTNAVSIAYPLLFIARHCMELGFKANIRYFAKYSDKDDYIKAGTHDLEILFRAFKLHLEETLVNLKGKYSIDVDKEDKKSFKELCKEVEKLNNTFHLIDKNSDAFRYPVDRNNNPSFKEGETINILDVKELLEKSMTLFFHTADVFGKYTEFANQIEWEYESSMRQQYEQNM